MSPGAKLPETECGDCCKYSNFSHYVCITSLIVDLVHEHQRDCLSLYRLQLLLVLWLFLCGSVAGLLVGTPQ